MTRINKFVFKYKAFGELRTAPDVIADLNRRAEAIADHANIGLDEPGFHVAGNITRGKTRRARAVVIAGNFEAMTAEAENRTLTRALDAGR